jgi:hypothetical protein
MLTLTAYILLYVSTVIDCRRVNQMSSIVESLVQFTSAALLLIRFFLILLYMYSY